MTLPGRRCRLRKPASQASALCPQCGHDLADRGLLPMADSFAGREHAEPFPTSHLMACQNCMLQLRWPQPRVSELNELYEAGAADSWTVDPRSRRDWRIASEWIAEIGARAVLDVGCFDGDFLSMLDGVSRRVGIEIQPDAATRAAARGIEILAGDYETLGSSENSFDCVTAFDVLEHSVDPAHLIRLLAASTRPGGHILVATGNTDAITWKLMGAGYWYCWPAEHVSFVNPRWLALTGERLGLRVERVASFSHGGDGSMTSVAEAAKNLAYRLAPAPLARLRRLQAARAGEQVRPAIVNSPPSWMSSRDHIIVLMRRDA